MGCMTAQTGIQIQQTQIFIVRQSNHCTMETPPMHKLFNQGRGPKAVNNSFLPAGGGRSLFCALEILQSPCLSLQECTGTQHQRSWELAV